MKLLTASAPPWARMARRARCMYSPTGVVAGELQGEVGLHAAADLDRPAGIHGPAALGELLSTRM